MNEFESFIDLLKQRPQLVLANHRGVIDDMTGTIAVFVGALQMDRGKLHDLLDIPNFMQWFSKNKPFGAESFVEWLMILDQQDFDDLAVLELFIQALENAGCK